MKRFFLIFITAATLSSCVTTTGIYESKQKIGKKAMAKVTFKTDKKGDYFELRGGMLGSTVYRGSYSKHDNTTDLNIEKVYYFANWSNGWTEAEYEASGTLLFIEKENGGRLKTIETPEKWDIIFAKIKYRGGYFVGEEGKGKVKNRSDRMAALCDFLKENGFKDHYEKGFKEVVIPFLFPEMYYQGFDKAVNFVVKKSSNLEVGHGILWDKNYTSSLELPANMAALRNSGTMWRDFEEAFALFYAIYNEEYFFNEVVSKGIIVETR